MKIEQLKPAPTAMAPTVKSMPQTVPSQPVIREPREGHSGYFFKENFWNLPGDEQRAKMMRVNADAALKCEWNTIVEGMRAPREIPPLMTEAQKAEMFAPPAFRERSEVFAMGQPQTIEEQRKIFAPTMQEAIGPIAPDLDKLPISHHGKVLPS
ncbi:MAG: hypothetical protein WB952_10810 [Terriglobales bacterium]